MENRRRGGAGDDELADGNKASEKDNARNREKRKDEKTSSGIGERGSREGKMTKLLRDFYFYSSCKWVGDVERNFGKSNCRAGLYCFPSIPTWYRAISGDHIG